MTHPVANSTAISMIVASVARHYELPPDRMFCPSLPRTQAVREARSVCYWLANELRPQLRLSLAELAGCLGRHRTTALHGIRVTARRRATDPWLKATTDRLLKDLQAL